MYLKTLELQGFKSFPDKTVIEFDKGMTAIVGANGSGKSNISDAVRWVLGEMSAKSLRGSKMEDVIFNGSSGRKGSNFAEVIMTIDNSDYLMKIDYDEVSVGRKLYRSGESEYSLNHKPCRLKDVVDLFLNTGIGREGYSVISQGKIAEIVSMKGNERRELFEEAAGISRFRYRKHEAQQKLVSVNDNAVRINDILSEVQGRIPRLEAQSAKAKIYLEIAEEKKSLELGIWANRFAEIMAQSARDAAAEKAQQAELDAVSDEITAQDARLEKLYVESQEKQIESEKLRQEIADLATRESEIVSSLSVLENEIRHMDLRSAETQQLGTERKEKLLALAAEQEKAQERFGLLQTALAEAEEREQKSKEDQLAAAKKLADLALREGETAKKERELFQEESRVSLALKEEEGFGRAREERIGVLQEEMQKWAGKKEERETRMESLSRKTQTAAQKEAVLREENGRLNLALYEIGQKLEEKTALSQQAQLSILTAQQRRETLLRMEKLLEGFSDSVKEIMNAAEKTLSGICGPVSKLISTEERYVLAMETALGGAVQNLVVETEKDAKEAISYLKNNRLGRATFLPLTTLRPQVYRTFHIRAKGYVGLASELCRCEEKYRPAVEFLLGKTLVCEDIDAAAALAREEKYAVKIVTLDGQIVHAGGAFSGGQAQKKSGVLSRTADLARLKDEIEKAAAEKEALDRQIRQAEEERSTLRGRLSENEAALILAEKNTREAKNTQYLEEESFRRNLQGLEQLEEEFSALCLAREEKKQQAEKSREAIRRIALEKERIAVAAEKIRLEKEEEEALREEILVQATEFAKERTEAQLRLESAAEELNALGARREELLDADRKKEEILKELAQQKETALARIEAEKKERLELTSRTEEKREAQIRLSGELSAAGEESARIRTEQKGKQARKETLLASLSRVRGTLAGMEREKESIEKGLLEEYELNVDSEEFRAAKEIDTEALGGSERLGELRAQIRKVGPVNLESIAELKEAKERFDFLNRQYSDIMESKEELEKMIRDLESTMREMFSETFEEIRFTFRRIFRELFGGGDADIELTDAEDLLNCGVEIRVQPPGKVIKNLSILSGGEQAFVAIALYMSLLEINPSPFCIFDEIESALDEANVRRFAEYIKKHNEKTQFIVITHRRGTMEEADTLYGITMQEKGISDFIRLDAGSINRFAQEN